MRSSLLLLVLAAALCGVATCTAYEYIDASNIDEAFAQAEIDLAREQPMGQPSEHHYFFNASDASNGAVYGNDVSTAVSTSQYQCLKQKGYVFTIIRAWRSLCSPDPNAPGTIKAAHAAGIKNVNVYMFPAFACGKSAKQQVEDTINHLAGSKFGMLWMDIEGAGSNWSKDQSKNRAWLREAVAHAHKRLGKGRVGVYSLASAWNVVMGSSCTEFSNLPLWYAHFDRNPSFSDWRSFGGWKKPAIKQFNDGPSVCGVGMDHNYYPA